jgi:hypothetical protein
MTFRTDLRLLLATALILAVAAPASARGTKCGVERWPIKVGRDNDVRKVDTTPVPSTIAELIALKAPANPNRRKKTRYAPTELKVFTVEATIKVIKPEADSDYHIVISDAEGHTMIVEAPHPNCAKGSRFEAQIAAVRAAINKHFGGSILKRMEPNIKAKITGIAFFDVLHGQEGVAPNGIELHPILEITFE